MLTGTWEWVGGEGGVGWYSPEVAEFTKTVSFSADSIYREYRNDSILAYETPFQVIWGPWFGGEYAYQIAMTHEIRGSTFYTKFSFIYPDSLKLEPLALDVGYEIYHRRK